MQTKHAKMKAITMKRITRSLKFSLNRNKDDNEGKFIIADQEKESNDSVMRTLQTICI